VALAAGGCFSLPKPPPFEREVASRQLEAVAAPVAALPEAAPVAGDGIARSISAPAALTPARPVARTNVRGEGDGSMEVESDERVTVTNKGFPHNAPNFSSEQAASMVCAAQKIGMSGETAKRMHDATLEAERVKKAWDEKRATQKDWEKAELKRQDAVINYMVPVPVLNWFVRPFEKKKDMPEPKWSGLVIEHTDAFTFQENGKRVTAVSGYVRNTGNGTVEVPPLTLRALDQWDYAIAGQTSLLPFVQLAPGQEKRFEVRFLNPPAYLAEVYAHFAPPFSYRSPRDCDFFDPATFDETGAIETKKATANFRDFFADPIPVSATHGGDYTAGELNELALFFRRESEAAWRCQNKAQADCITGPGAQRMHWRDMFVLSESIDEAWIAFRAAEETRTRVAGGVVGGVVGGVADTVKADAARDEAVAKFRAMAEAALARTGGSAEGVEVNATSSYGRDEDGLYIEIAGGVRNASGESRQVDNLMVAFVDRRELPLSSIAMAVDMQLAPGETREFSQRLQAGAAGRRRSYAPARIPPRDIPWEVRVGAMARAAAPMPVAALTPAAPE
jgi:hypothetical protein